MSKKIIVFALAVVSAAFFALSAMASAQEIHLEPAEAFSISGPGGELRAAGEPTLTCSGLGGSGQFDTASTTTGSLTLDYTGCHTAQFGFTTTCKSEGAATAGTIATGGTFHMITITSGAPAVLLTTNSTVLVCAGISTMTRTGSVIGTIISPKCGESSKTLTISFTGTESTQSHLTYTGSKFDLSVKTGTGEEKTIALVETTTNIQANAGKLNCT